MSVRAKVSLITGGWLRLAPTEENMDKEIINEVLKRLDTIGEKIGVGADYFWPKFVKQELIEAWVSLGSLIFFGVLFFLVAYYAGKFWDQDHQNRDRYSICRESHEPLWISSIVVLGIGFIVSTVAFFCEFFDVFNPEYWALKSLFTTIK